MNKILIRFCLSMSLILMLTAQSGADGSEPQAAASPSQENFGIEAGSGSLIASQQKLSIEGVGLSSGGEGGLVDEPLGLLSIEEQGSQGLQIDRLTGMTESEVGTLRAGLGWTSFNEYLQQAERSDLEQDDRHIESRINWLTANGFSIALETSATPAFINSDRPESNGQIDNSASVVLSWRPDQNGNPGEYRISAIGTRLNLNPGRSGFDGSNVAGWGLNLQGNWEIGDLVAALSVTYGQGIDSYILRRDGKDLYVMAGNAYDPSSSFSIQPSLYYALSDKSKFHVVLGHHQGQNYESNPEFQERTLDTLHLEYTWSPWPKTELGLTLSREEQLDATSSEDSSVILFEGSKEF